MTLDGGARLRRFLDDLAGSGDGPGPSRTIPGPANRIVAARVDSTNRLARGVVATYLADEVRPPALLILALEQTEGRGRRGRAWASPAGAGVYVTRVLPLPENGPGEGEGGGEGENPGVVHRAIQSLPLLVAVGLARAIAGLLPDDAERPRLKWPNDVLIGGRKIAGILAESLALGSGPPVALLGYGVNHARPRPDLRAGAPSDGPGLPEGATTLSDHLASPPSLGATARALVAGVEAELAHLGDLGYAVPAYRELSAHRPGDRLRCRSGDETVEGEFEGFDERGHLRLRRGGETVLLAAGEIVEDRTHDG